MRNKGPDHCLNSTRTIVHSNEGKIKCPIFCLTLKRRKIQTVHSWLNKHTGLCLPFIYDKSSSYTSSSFSCQGTSKHTQKHILCLLSGLMAMLCVLTQQMHRSIYHEIKYSNREFNFCWVREFPGKSPHSFLIVTDEQTFLLEIKNTPHKPCCSSISTFFCLENV